ncbi:hypothetical protein HY416_04170 [Candidatus Kaiserbacteria bacterium]|nr:hypothetical protein [Candidatus Kaiserbacteria bacterium]
MSTNDEFVSIPSAGEIEVGSSAVLEGVVGSVAVKREDARSKIAFAYVIGFLGILLFAMILFGAGKMETNSLIDLITAISAILSGPLGFIIGFYFKSQTGEEG